MLYRTQVRTQRSGIERTGRLLTQHFSMKKKLRFRLQLNVTKCFTYHVFLHEMGKKSHNFYFFSIRHNK